ncbi:hypothetical protein [Ensifer sesbaniae]|uniref:hypothetical protein n=1 Tax=Ensifer sesbaniae TaxID=1214071 RepID=UPI0015690272|nr:hypothetical protein [Ensifer sesbaniae]NRQ13448.1 hypothetical protein [Ensifer sesbaniae]
MPLDILSNHKALLAQIDCSTILQKIQAFGSLDIKSISDRDLQDSILDVLTGGTRRATLTRHSVTIPAGARLFRARSAEPGEHHIPFSCGKISTDAWAPEAKYVKSAGRLHKAGEPLFYSTLGHPLTTLNEIRLPQNEYAIVFEFVTQRPLTATSFGFTEMQPGYSSDELAKINLVEDFLYAEFSRDVPKGMEHRYRVSEHIAKDYFDLPGQDAWCFPSVQDRQQWNVVFRPKQSTECLDLVGGMVYRRRDGADSIVAVCRLMDGKFIYERLGGPMHRDYFPNVSLPSAPPLHG